MSITSPTSAPPASTTGIEVAAHSQWTFGRLLLRILVILTGIAVGGVLGIVVALITGWIDLPIRC
jgi:hypothetical protein